MAVDVVKIVLIGMVCWLVAFFVLLFAFRHQLDAHHSSYWLWTCLAGIGLGFIGIPYARRVDRRDSRAHASAGEGEQPGTTEQR
jgi:membrane protein DedA with SNARE-associated domain